MEAVSPGFWLSLILFIFGLGGADDGPSMAEFEAERNAGVALPWLLAAVEHGDDYSLTLGIEQAYQAAGASQNELLTWQFQPFDGIVNWYNEYTEVINLSALPTEDQVAPYWDNWSQVLTGGRWDWRGFFADADEARDMARFNQLVLAAHEYGHALAYRYDPEHVRRENGEVNCRELAADRLAAGLIEELADADAQFAHWRGLYAELAAAINAEIDPASRYSLADYASLDADCHVISVAQPTEDTMTPYASAYFARWQVLLAADLPPLADLYETHLFAPLRAALPPTAPLATSVTTIAAIDAELGGFEHGSDQGWRLPAFAPDGTLFVMDYAVLEGEDQRGLYVAYGPAGAKRKPVLDTPHIEADLADAYFFDLTSLLPLGPDRFLTASSDMWGEASSLVLIDFRRGKDGWTHRIVQPLPGQPNLETRLRRAADGSALLEVFHWDDDNSGYWKRYGIDLDTLTLGEEERVADDGYRRYNDLPDGRGLLLHPDRPMLLLEDGDAILRIAGNGLEGFKDNLDPLQVEFLDPIAAIGRGDAVLVLDVDPISDLYVIREVVLAP